MGYADAYLRTSFVMLYIFDSHDSRLVNFNICSYLPNVRQEWLESTMLLVFIDAMLIDKVA